MKAPLNYDMSVNFNIKLGRFGYGNNGLPSRYIRYSIYEFNKK
ncbi:MAG: hypothetical protein [Bacteriophage sp.]|nr:MAG: hypothetical protein [Bacteriophage sp.]